PDREDRQGCNLRPRHLQMDGGDRELYHEPEEQKRCPLDLVGTVAGELDAVLTQGVQLEREIEPGPLHRQTATPENWGDDNSLDEVVESCFRSIGTPSMPQQRPLLPDDGLRIGADQIAERGTAQVVIWRKMIDLEQRVAFAAYDPHRLGIA